MDLSLDLLLLAVEAIEQHNIQSENPLFYESLTRERVKIYG